MDVQEIMAAAREGNVDKLAKMLPNAEPFHTGNAMTAAIEACQNEAFDAILPVLSEQAIGGALIAACHHGRPAFVRRLLAEGAPPEGNEDDGSPLGRVVANATPERADEYLECLRILLAAGVDVNRADSRGTTPILTVARTGFSVDAARILVEAGADLLVADNKDWVLLDWAAFDYLRRDKSELQAFLREAYEAAC